MTRRLTRAAVAVAALAVAPAALAQDPPAPGAVTTAPVTTTPAVTTPAPAAPTDVRQQVRREGRAMVWRITFRVPEGTQGAVPFRWVAYGGSRTDRELRRRAAGNAAPVPRGGVVTFSRRVALPVAGAMSGGFCAEIPGAGPCPDGPATTRGRLPARVPEVTVIADSVGTGLDYIEGGRARATGDWSALFDLKVCRRLVAPPCPPNPPSALQVIRSLGTAVGDIAVVHVGYNDSGGAYDIGAVMTALKQRGVTRVVWVNLQGIAPFAPGVNAAIRRAAGRYQWMQVADWNSRSAGRAWFTADRDHVTPSGAYALADFYREEITRAIREMREGQPAR